jgi:DNA replication initiation complex subunit (GINS family)
MKQLLDSEEQSEELTRLPRDVYQRTATYIQKLRKGSEMGTGDPSAKLAKKQLWLLEGMGRQLLSRRLAKVSSGRADARQLLPEEKFVYEMHLDFERTRQKFTDAIANGQPSVFTLLQKNQLEKMVTVSFQRPLGEIVGFDLNRYGPFKAHDVALLPAANAEVLISNGDAKMVYPGDSV